MARATQFVNFAPAGAPFGNIPLPQPELSPLTGQGWWVVIANFSETFIEVFSPWGPKYVPPFVTDVFGTPCDVMPIGDQQPIRLVFVNPTLSTVAGAVSLSWATAPDSYGPDQATYPMAIGA